MQQADQAHNRSGDAGSSGISNTFTATLIDPFQALYEATCDGEIVADLIDLAVERVTDLRAGIIIVAGEGAGTIRDRDLRVIESVLRAADAVQRRGQSAVMASDARLHALHVPAYVQVAA